MSDTDFERRKPTTVATRIPLAAAVAVACIGLAACGSSKSSSSTAARTAASTSAAGAPGTPGPPGKAGTPGTPGGRFAALRECLQKSGITLPQRAPGAASLQPPKGVSRAQYAAALKKCAGTLFKGRRSPNGSGRLQALTKFAACMRQSGVNVQAPNTSGKGPIFSAKGLDTNSAQFKSAFAKCRAALISNIGRGIAGTG
ncbi:MAG TPA: hypothetical protein VGG98_05455 [Solirubrobacteraceae bacterium]|jgi:hypothetical protein